MIEADGRPFAALGLGNLNLADRTGYLRYLVPDLRQAPDWMGSTIADVVSAFIGHVTRVYPLRKLYLEWVEEVPIPGQIVDFMVLEGRLLEYVWLDGHYHDVSIFTMYSDGKW